MTNNLSLLDLLIDIKNDDEFYVVLITDVNLYIPLMVSCHTNLEVLKNQIVRICKKRGKAYLFLDKKSIRKCLEQSMIETVKVLNYKKDISHGLRNLLSNIFSKSYGSIKQAMRYTVTDDLNLLNHEILIKAIVNNQNLYIGNIHKINSRIIKYLKTYHNYKESVKLLIFTKSWSTSNFFINLKNFLAFYWIFY